MATQFIYTNPAAGQQAVQYAQMKQQMDLEREAGIDDMYMNTARQATAQMGTLGNMALSRAEMDRSSALDAERKRQFDQALQLDRDRLTAATKSDADRAAAIQSAKDAEYDRQAEMWEQKANALNANPPKPGEKIPSGIVFDPITKRYVPLMRRRQQALAVPTVGQQVESIDSIRQRTRELLGVNNPAASGGQTGVAVPIPSPGPRAPAPTDFRVPIQYPGGPLIQTMPTMPTGPMMVIPQSEITDMLDYEESVRQPRPLNYTDPRFAVPPEAYIQTDIPPYRR